MAVKIKSIISATVFCLFHRHRLHKAKVLVVVFTLAHVTFLQRWFLYPPEKTPTFNPDKTTLHWLVEDYPHLKTEDLPMECTIGPGQVSNIRVLNTSMLLKSTFKIVVCI